MAAPALLAAAAKAAKAAKTAKQVSQLVAGQKNDDQEEKRKKRKLLILLALSGSGGLLPVGIFVVVLALIFMSSMGGAGGGASAATCREYADAANAGNTGPAADTSPIMPGDGMYTPSEAARNEIPPRMMIAAMRAAARYDGLDWTLIAGQMYQETKYGQDPSAAPGGANSLGYMGILQFGDPAWKDYGADGNNDGKKDLYNVDDAAFAAANFLHAKNAETNAGEALRIYSGSTRSNTIYLRVVLTQAARYRGAFTTDEDLIKRWYRHLGDTVRKNPGFPTLGQQSGIPAPVGNNAQISQAKSIRPAPAQEWSTPPLDGAGGPSTEQAAFPGDFPGGSLGGFPGESSGRSTGGTTPAAGPAMAPVGHARPAAAPLAPADEPVTGEDWQWPMKEGTYQVGTPYHKEGNMWSLGYHTGLDLVAGTGAALYAPADGTVTKASGGGSYGNETNIRHAGGVVTLYAHQDEMFVSVGDRVKRGDRIGTVGATGNVTGPHLHWEVRVPGVDNPFVPGQDQGPGMVDPKDWLDGKVTANPDYGAVPGGAGEGDDRNAQFAECAAEAGNSGVAPDGAGSTGVMPAADDPLIRAVLGWAQRGIGTPYVLGAPRLQGTNPTSFDCSSFTQWAYYMASDGKIDIGATTFTQEPALKKYEISLSEAQPGDLIFFNPSKRGSEHVGMVWDPSGKKIIHAPRPGKSVEFSTWDVQDKITGVYRVPIPQGSSPVEGDGKPKGA